MKIHRFVATVMLAGVWAQAHTFESRRGTAHTIGGSAVSVSTAPKVRHGSRNGAQPANRPACAVPSIVELPLPALPRRGSGEDGSVGLNPPDVKAQGGARFTARPFPRIVPHKDHDVLEMVG